MVNQNGWLIRSEFMGTLFLLIFILVVYFIPAIVAWSRSKINTPAIFTLNLLFGWTLIGWAIALIWAVSVDDKARV